MVDVAKFFMEILHGTKAAASACRAGSARFKCTTCSSKIATAAPQAGSGMLQELCARWCRTSLCRARPVDARPVLSTVYFLDEVHGAHRRSPLPTEVCALDQVPVSGTGTMPLKISR